MEHRQRWGWDSSGGEGGVRRPTGFVISRVMQDVWQLFRILTVLSSAWLPPWQVVICTSETFHWVPVTPWWGLRSYSSGPDSREPPKVLVLITQKDSLPDSGMWSSLGSQQAWTKMKAASPSCTECAVHTPSLLMSVRFCSARDHTQTRVHKHCKPHML